MKTLLLALTLLTMTGCTINYIHGTDVTLHQGEQGMDSVD